MHVEFSFSVCMSLSLYIYMCVCVCVCVHSQALSANESALRTLSELPVGETFSVSSVDNTVSACVCACCALKLND